MADLRAIGGVSATLQALLRDRMEIPAEVPGGVDVTVGLPEPRGDEDNAEPARVNLFLYKVSENEFLKNQDIGSWAPRGGGHGPPLSLVLHYLLTAFGSTSEPTNTDLQNETIAHFLLGSAMRVLHENAVITDSVEDGAGEPILHASLLDQVERFQVTLDPMDLDTLSKIWMGLGQPMRSSAAYTVQVVQIERTVPRAAAPPVETRRLFASARKRPFVSRVYRVPQAGETVPDQRLAIGEQVRIEGENFISEETSLRIGEIPPFALDRNDPLLTVLDTRIELALPDDVDPTGATIEEVDRLQPGAQSVSVLASFTIEGIEGGMTDRGVPIEERRELESNEGLFLLVPTLDATTPLVPTSGSTSDLLTVNGTRLWSEEGESSVLVGDVAIPVREPEDSDPWAAPSPTSVEVSLEALEDAEPGLEPGAHPVRVLVNGALTREVATFTLTA